MAAAPAVLPADEIALALGGVLWYLDPLEEGRDGERARDWGLAKGVYVRYWQRRTEAIAVTLRGAEVARGERAAHNKISFKVLGRASIPVGEDDTVRIVYAPRSGGSASVAVSAGALRQRVYLRGWPLLSMQVVDRGGAMFLELGTHGDRAGQPRCATCRSHGLRADTPLYSMRNCREHPQYCWLCRKTYGPRYRRCPVHNSGCGYYNCGPNGCGVCYRSWDGTERQ